MGEAAGAWLVGVAAAAQEDVCLVQCNELSIDDQRFPMDVSDWFN